MSKQTQTEAQQLASTTPSLRGGDWGDKAVAELRRLDAANAELLNALKTIASSASNIKFDAYSYARATIAKHGEKQMITKQDIEDYSEVSKQPSRYSEEFRQKQQLKDYLPPSFAEWTSNYVRDNLYKLKLK